MSEDLSYHSVTAEEKGVGLGEIYGFTTPMAKRWEYHCCNSWTGIACEWETSKYSLANSGEGKSCKWWWWATLLVCLLSSWLVVEILVIICNNVWEHGILNNYNIERYNISLYFRWNLNSPLIIHHTLDYLHLDQHSYRSSTYSSTPQQ